jgi:hypothetical protein
MDNPRIKDVIINNKFDYYYLIFKYAKASNTFMKREAKKLMRLSFGEVEYIKKCVGKGEYTRPFELVFGVIEEDILNSRAKDFFLAMNYIVEQLTLISNAEQELQADPDPIFEEAGGNRLKRFGSMNAMIGIAKDYSVLPHEVEKWDYQRVFTLLLHSKTSNEINREYSRLLNQISNVIY